MQFAFGLLFHDCCRVQSRWSIRRKARGGRARSDAGARPAGSSNARRAGRAGSSGRCAGYGKRSMSSGIFWLVQHFDAGHVHFTRARIADVEREEVHVIVDVAGVAIELGIAVNLEMLAGIEQRPGGRGKADGAHIEIVDARAALREDAVHPRQRALVRDGIHARRARVRERFPGRRPV